MAPHDKAGSALTFPPPPPPPVPPLLLLLLPPQPAAIRASAPTAARSSAIETRLLTLPPPWPVSVSVSVSAKCPGEAGERLRAGQYRDNRCDFQAPGPS